MKTPSTSIAPILAVSILGAISAAGCARFSGAGTSTGDELDLLAMAESFWAVEGATATAPRTGATRLAIAEFTVEFVDNAAPPIDGATSNESSPFGTGMKLALPGALYRGFVATLRPFRRDVVPLEDLLASAAYNGLETLAEAKPAAYSVDGLSSFGDELKPGTKKAFGDLARELEADGVLRVLLRVGIRDGRATLEKGSAFEVLRDGNTVRLVTKRTVIAPTIVVSAEDNRSVITSEFVRSQETLFDTAVALAFLLDDAKRS